MTETLHSSSECNTSLPVALSPNILDGMKIHCGSRLWWASWNGCIWKKTKENVWGLGGWCLHFWVDWHSSSQRVIHSEREEQVPPLQLPVQVYDNPNKLWCAAQTLKTLIGTKSNRLCLAGQRELRVTVCALCTTTTINFSLSSNPPSLQSTCHLSLILPFVEPYLGSTRTFPLLWKVFFCTKLFSLQPTW